jgi:mycofactocin precursor peptide peptidase
VTRLDRLTWPDVAALADRSLLVVPVGSTEQHGPHLPLATDLLIAVALADRLAAARDDVLVAPGVPYGSSGEHAGFAGTLSIGQGALETVLVELVRSADAFRAVLIVSGHGGNGEAVARAMAIAAREGRRAAAWSPRVVGGDAHAGRTETSMLLALGEPVLVDRAAPGDMRPIAELLPDLRAGGVASIAANGVLGDPTRAAAGEGQQILEQLTADLAAFVDAFVAGLPRSTG